MQEKLSPVTATIVSQIATVQERTLASEA